jgi:hypothetical protein
MKSEMVSEGCLDCPYIEDHLDIVLKFYSLEEQARRRDVLVSEAAVACRGIQKFWREGLLGQEDVKRCPFQFHAPVVKDDSMLDNLAQVASTQPRRLIRE